MAAYPNLEYGNLYNALTILIDVAPSIQYGQVGKLSHHDAHNIEEDQHNILHHLYLYFLIVFGKALLQCLCCILPFLDKDLIDNLPYLASSTISVLPASLHLDIVNALCYYILPFTISKPGPTVSPVF